MNLSKKKDEFFFNNILELYKNFKINNNQEELFIILYKMRVIHGIMITRLEKQISKINNCVINNETIPSKNYYNLSILENLVNIIRKLINKCENKLQNNVKKDNKKIINNNNLNDSDSILETDIENIQNKDSDRLYNKNDNENKIIIMFFFAEWCGFCKKFFPIWEEFKKYMKKNHKEIILLNLNGDEENTKVLMKKYNIRGYPTVMLKHNKKIIEFEENRTLEKLIDFIEKNI